MEKTTNDAAEELDSLAGNAEESQLPSAPSFERPSIDEVSLCCEISAYAPDDDDRPLF